MDSEDQQREGDMGAPPQRPRDDYLTPTYGRTEFQTPAPRTQIPRHSMPPESAYRIVADELNLDGRTGLNMATFVNTWMDDWATRLVVENLGKNFIDHEEYPQAYRIEKRIVWMLGDWFGTRFDPKDLDPETATGFYGTATIGTSEAVMLGLVAHRWAWQNNHLANANSNPLDRPFVLMSAHAHSCWDKYCRYYDVGAIYVPMTDTSFGMSEDAVYDALASNLCDGPYAEQVKAFYKKHMPESQFPDFGGRTLGELVMAVGSVVGSTYTGNSDDVAGASVAIDRYCEEHQQLGVSIPIHVDAASGGFILPFTNKLKGDPIPFDFNSVPRVKSINVSNHKFGLTCAGMGTVVFRDASVVDSDELIYQITYLGGRFDDYTVNFSRGTGMILAQYYNLLRFGLRGYRAVELGNVRRARCFVNDIERDSLLGRFLRHISDQQHYPIVVLGWAEPSQAEQRRWTLKDLSDALRMLGWIVPTYQLPLKNPKDTKHGLHVLRVVVRQNISADLLSRLVCDMRTIVEGFEDQEEIVRPMAVGDRC